MKATYFGHSAFRFDLERTVVLVDPFLRGNPHFTGNVEEATKGCTHILLTHGHSDHVGDTVEIAGRTGATVVAMVELGSFMAKAGVRNVVRANTGGTVRSAEFSVTLTQAFHSTSNTDEDGRTVYLGMPNGLVLRPVKGPTIYHMGDTDIFGDMQLIDDLHHPRVGLVPIGDHFTMGAEAAALACRRFFAFETIIPIHWGTMPVLAPSPADFIERLGDMGPKVFVPPIGQEFEL